MGKESTRRIGRLIPILLWLIFMFLLGFLVGEKKSPKESLTDKQYIEYLESQLDSLSNLEKEIDLQIDTITVEIEKVKIKYEKEHNIILNNTPSEDYEFFTNYINSNRERFCFDINRTIEDN